MQKKNSGWIFLYFVIALLFAAGAFFKTISDDSTVIAMQWVCAVVFSGLGILQLVKRKPAVK